MFFFFFNDTATTEIYTLSLHDALPILFPPLSERFHPLFRRRLSGDHLLDRKSTRLNSSHLRISYAVFCLKKTKRMISKPPDFAMSRHSSAAVSLIGAKPIKFRPHHLGTYHRPKPTLLRPVFF